MTRLSVRCESACVEETKVVCARGGEEELARNDVLVDDAAELC